MQLALVSVAPYVLLGFAAVSCRSARAGLLNRRRTGGNPVSIGTAAPIRAACRVEIDPDVERQLENSAAAPQPRPTGVTVLGVHIDAAGSIAQADVLTTSGFPVLDTTALTLVRSARMDPATAGKYRATIVFTE
ncbi:MAG: hypothetical protein NVSMB19_20580 [Vulcanimicrobiaceae bacterium]